MDELLSALIVNTLILHREIPDRSETGLIRGKTFEQGKMRRHNVLSGRQTAEEFIENVPPGRILGRDQFRPQLGYL